jgi:antitoxin VapB
MKLHHSWDNYTMALNLKNPEVEALAAEVAKLAGTTKTEAIRQALMEKREQLIAPTGQRVTKERAIRFLREQVWPFLPPDASRRLSKAEEEEILGIGPNGYCE